MSAKSLMLLAGLLFAGALWSQAPALRAWWPHLALVWIVIAAARVETGPLLLAAAITGLIEDVMFGSAFGIHPLGLITAAAAARQWRHHLAPGARLNAAVFVFLFAAGETMLLGMTVGGLAGAWHGLSLRGALTAALAAALIAAPLDRSFPRPIAAGPAPRLDLAK